MALYPKQEDLYSQLNQLALKHARSYGISLIGFRVQKNQLELDVDCAGELASVFRKSFSRELKDFFKDTFSNFLC